MAFRTCWLSHLLFFITGLLAGLVGSSLGSSPRQEHEIIAATNVKAPSGILLVGPTARSMDPQESHTSLRSLLNETHNRSRLMVHAAKWSDRASIDEIVEEIGNASNWRLDDKESRVVKEILIARLASLDGEIAVAVADNLLADKDNAGADWVLVAYSAWLDSDPSAAFAHAKQELSPETGESYEFLGDMLRQFGQADRQKADAMAAQFAQSANPLLMSTGEGYRALRLVEDWHKHENPIQAFAWIENIRPSAGERQRLQAKVLDMALDTGEEPAVYAALQRIGVIQDDISRSTVIRNYADVFPDDIRTVIARTQTDDAKAIAVGEALAAQQGANRVATMNWVLAWPEGLARDQALLRAATALEPVNRALAVTALSGLKASPEQSAKLHQIGFDWLHADSEAARKALPQEVVRRYDQLTAIYKGGTLNVIPGMSAELNFK